LAGLRAHANSNALILQMDATPHEGRRKSCSRFFYWNPLLEPGAIDVVEYRWCFRHATGIHNFLNHRDDFFPH